MNGEKDELAERRERRLGEAQVHMGPKGLAVWAAYDARAAALTGEDPTVSEARRRLVAGATDILLGRAMIKEGFLAPDWRERDARAAGAALRYEPPFSSAEVQRVRKLAKTRGLRLKLSRRRDQGAPDYGTVWLADEAGGVVLGGEFGVTLDEVSAFLKPAVPPRPSKRSKAPRKAPEARKRAAHGRREVRKAEPKTDPPPRPERAPRPDFAGQCTGTTNLGRRCRFPADGEDGRCTVHRDPRRR